MAINAGTINAAINLRYEQFERGLDRVNTRFNNFGRNMQSTFSRLSQASSSLAGLGIGAGITGLGRESIQTVTGFDDAMAKVRATTQSTEEDFLKLRNQALELGRVTPWMASQVAEGMNYLALAGWDVNQIYTAMPGMLDLASAGAMDLARAADITSDVMTAFSLTAEQSTHTADVFAYAQANANTNIEMLGEAMKYAAPMANDMRWSLEETTAAMMELANNGIKGSMAGQAFATSIGRLTKPVGAAKKIMNELNIEFFDANGQMKSLPDVIAELERATEGMTDKQRAATLTTIFGAEAYKHWSILLKGGSKALAETTENLKTADGTAKRMADTMQDTLGGAFRALSSAWEGLMISFGDELKPFVRKIAEWLTEIVRYFDSLSPATKKVIVVILALVAGLALLLGLIAPLGFLIEGIVLLATALPAIGGALASIAGPALLIIGIIAALIALGYGLYKAWNENLWGIQDKFYSFKEWIVKTVKEIISVWNNFLDIFKSKGAEDALSYLESTFKGKFGAIFSWLESKFPNLSAYFNLVWQHIKENADKIIGVVSELAGKIKDHFLELMGIPGKFIKAWQEEGPEKAFEYLGKAIADSIYRIFDINKTIISSGKTIGETILSFYKKNKKDLINILKGLIESGKNTFKDLQEWFVDGWASAFNHSKESFGNFFDFISNNWYRIFDIFDWGTAFIKGFLDELLLKFFNFDGGISGIIDNIKERFSNWVVGLIEDGKKIMENIAEGIRNFAHLPKKALEEALAKLRDLLPSSDAKEGPLSQLTHNGEKIPGTLAEGVMRGKQSLLTAMNDSLQDVRDSISINGQLGLTASASVGTLPTDLITEPVKQETNNNDNRTINVYALNKDELLELLEDILDDEIKSNL